MSRRPVGRQQLLDAARTELASGNGSLELSALTRRTGLSTGALYHHFGSKAGLFTSIYNSFYEGLREAIADVHLPEAGWAVREQERTRRFVSYHFADSLALLMLDRAALDPLIGELETSHIQGMIGNGADNIRRGQEQGDITRNLDAESAAAYVIGGLRHGIAQQLRATPRPTPDQASERLWRLTAGTLELVHPGNGEAAGQN